MSSLKALLIPAQEHDSHAFVNASGAYLVAAGFQVPFSGRFWVPPGEGRVASASARADALSESILARAFRGELVPTEAELARADGRDYESGEALLARIRGERATIAPPSKGQRGGALPAGARS